MDYKALNQSAIPFLPNIIKHLGLYGRYEGRWFVALNPTRHDRYLGSFRINMDTGYWCDYALNDAYGDVIGLVAYINGWAQNKAAQYVADIVECRP